VALGKTLRSANSPAPSSQHKCLAAGPGGGEERVDVGVAGEVADDRTNGTDMEMKPLGDFGGGYRFVEVRATDLVVTLGGEVRLLEQAREFWGTSHRSRGKTGLTTQENECEKGKLGPITKSEPISIVKPEPPVAAGQGSGCPAHTTKPLGTQGSARSDVESGMWRGGVSPLGSGARTIPVKGLVVGRATAESPGAGCGAGRDRMTSVLSRGSSVSRWRRWIRAWGRDERASDEPAA